MSIGCSSPPKLVCHEIDIIKNTIKNNYSADEVEITSRVFKEEIYFDKIKSVYVTVYNATTETLDFKSLPIDKYERFENYQEIEDGLENEGKRILDLIRENCDLENFNEVIVVFGKRGKNDPLLYDFIVHYKI